MRRYLADAAVSSAASGPSWPETLAVAGLAGVVAYAAARQSCRHVEEKTTRVQADLDFTKREFEVQLKAMR